jgi:peptide/nickel transport system permease protein
MRLEDKSSLYADISISEKDLESLNVKTDFQSNLHSLLRAMFFFEFGKTDSGEDVLTHILTKTSASLYIAIIATLFGSFLGIFFSLLYFFVPKIISSLFSLSFKTILSTPIFIISILLFLFFFYYLGILPPGGFEKKQFVYLILPSLALGSRLGSRLYFFSLNEIQKEKTADYIFFYKANGATKTYIYFNLILKKILPFLLVFILLEFCSLLSGSLIVEEIFSFPGIGKSMYYAAKVLDQSLLQSILLFTGILFYIFTRTAKLIQKKILTQE